MDQRHYIQRICDKAKSYEKFLSCSYHFLGTANTVSMKFFISFQKIRISVNCGIITDYFIFGRP